MTVLMLIVAQAVGIIVLELIFGRWRRCRS